MPDQVIKDNYNIVGRVAGLYLSGKGTSEIFAYGLLRIRLQGGIEDQLKVGEGLGGGVGEGVEAGLRHVRRERAEDASG